VSTPLPEPVRRRLVQLIGMTGSIHDPEALTALRLAQRTATEHGMTLVEFLTPPAAAVVSGPELNIKRLAQLEKEAFERGHAAGRKAAMTEGPVIASWPMFAHHCLTNHRPILNQFEHSFLEGFLERGFSTPTQKQQLVMVKIAAKCGLRPPS